MDGWVRENAKKASVQLKIDEWVGEKDERKILFVGPIRHKKETLHLHNATHLRQLQGKYVWRKKRNVRVLKKGEDSERGSKVSPNQSQS